MDARIIAGESGPAQVRPKARGGIMTLGVVRRFAGTKERWNGDEYHGYADDTEYLMASPENARVLMEALAEARAGKGTRFANVEEMRRALGL
ncbi:MAG TPA: hypothetical protein VIB55_12940 [Longimicrobium sp.]|jgi:hypothetical protein